MKGARLSALVSFLDKELSLSAFPDDDSSNGLQVEGCPHVRRIAVSVDACEYVIRKAAEQNADLLFVHHGLIWGGLKRLEGLVKNRIRAIFDADISLYACHLPLDSHMKYGNNARLIDLLSLRMMGEFGTYHGKKIGYWGRTRRQVTLEEFTGHINRMLATKASFVDFGRPVRNVGIVSGGGWSAITEADKTGIDTFLTGEPSHSAYTIAEEMRVNLIFAGHYATETPGVKAVGAMLEKKYQIPVTFIDHPTGL